MPGDDGVGFDDHQTRAPARPEPGQPHPENPIAPTKARTLHRPFENAELLAQGQILGNQGGARKEGGAKETENQPYHVHRIGSVRVL